MPKIDFKKLNLLSRLGNIGIKEFIGIDFGSNNLKVSHVRASANKREVLDLLMRNISGLPDYDIARTISACLAQLKAKNADVLDIIPSHQVITKNIEIPSINPQEIKEIISLQAGRHTPYSREEIIVDYINIGTYKHNYTKVLLVIVARSVVKRHIEILEKAGVKSERILFAPEALGWAASKILKLENQDSPVNVIHIEESFTDFTVILKNKLAFIRNIPIGAGQLVNEKERYQMRFAEELRNSLEAYQSEDIERAPNMLILTGAVDEMEDLKNILHNTLHAPVRLSPYYQSTSIQDNAFQAISQAKQSSFLNVIASLLCLEDLKVDLVPEEIKLKKAILEREKDLLKTGMLVLIGSVLIFFTLISKIYFKSAYLGNLNTEYEALSHEAQGLEKDFSKISLVKNHLLSRGYSLEVLTELHHLVPLELKLENIRFDNQGRFSIKGTADTMSAVYTFVDNMEKSQYFQAVKTKYTSKRKDGLKDVTDFEITAQLEKEA